MKKILSTILLLISILILQACDFSTLSIPRYRKKTTSENIPTENFERSTLDNIASYKDAYSYKDVLKMIGGIDGYMPSTGNVKVLVVPIQFSDVYTSKTSLTKYRTDLERTFFGTDTGYESLSTYYQKSSYGKLNISGEVLPWYSPLNKSTYYEAAYENDSSMSKIMGELAIEAISYYSSSIDLSEYDYDKDGILDGVYLVCNKNLQKYNSLYWSWVSYYNGKKQVDGYDIYQVMWSNISFIYHDDFYKPVEEGKVNAITFIHESGHMMGCDDFYDYSANEYSDSIFGKKLKTSGKGCNLGFGTFDMMDGNVGDHCANTKMMLGWINPYVVTKNTTIKLNKFSSSGDAIIVAPSFNMDSGNLSEYFVIEYYDHDGLANQNIFDSRGYTKSGIRIYHINSRVTLDGSYWSIFKYDNSYTNRAFITLINANTNLKGKTDFIDSSENASDKVFFKEGDKFSPIDNNEYENKLLLNVEISIDELDDENATISIKFKN